MDIQFKSHATGKTAVIDYNKFKDRIRKGELFPLDQVRDRVLTDDRWWPVNDLSIFHRLSPTHYAKGRRLIARENAEQEMQRFQESGRIPAAKHEALAREFFQLGVSRSAGTPSAFSRFLVTSNEEPLVHDEFAVRFTYLRSFHIPLFVRASRRGAEWKLDYKAGEGSRITRPLPTSDGTHRILHLADALNRTEMPLDDNVRGLDGSVWALEIFQHDHYTFRYRWSPPNELGGYLVELSGLVSSDHELY